MGNIDTFRNWLKAKGLSLKDFASTCGISYSTVSKYSPDQKQRPRFKREQIIRKHLPDCPLVRMEPIK